MQGKGKQAAQRTVEHWTKTPSTFMSAASMYRLRPYAPRRLRSGAAETVGPPFHQRWRDMCGGRTSAPCPRQGARSSAGIRIRTRGVPARRNSAREEQEHAHEVKGETAQPECKLGRKVEPAGFQLLRPLLTDSGEGGV